MSEMYLENIDRESASKEEMGKFFDSKRENYECAKAIKEAVDENFTGMRLDTESVLDTVLSEFEPERVEYCLAVFIDSHPFDRRIDEENKEWAKDVLDSIPDIYSSELATSWITNRSPESGLLNLVADDFREQFPDLELKAEHDNQRDSLEH